LKIDTSKNLKLRADRPQLFFAAHFVGRLHHPSQGAWALSEVHRLGSAGQEPPPG